MREVAVPQDVAALYAACDAPLLHRQVDPRAVSAAWVADDGRTALWLARGPATSADRPAPVVATAVGEPRALGVLLARAAREAPAPSRLTVEAAAADAVPAAWARASTWSWHWMTVGRDRFAAADPDPGGAATLDLGLRHDDEVEALLLAGHPGSFARPGTPGVLSWHGVREEGTGTLVATGCLVAQPDGSGLLRGVTTHPDHRGRGLGLLVSASLTRAALRLDPVAALGVYTDNAPALAVYDRLGYAVVHSFVSGPVGPVAASSTTAAEPSR